MRVKEIFTLERSYNIEVIVKKIGILIECNIKQGNAMHQMFLLLLI